MKLTFLFTQEISRRIKFELEITASIGVANNKITAKLGSDYKKPDAITRVEKDNYKEIVYPLPVEDLLYVGPTTKEKLRRGGITTIGALAQATVDEMRNRYGYMSLQRALIFTDPILGKINPKDDHSVHPVGYFAG